MWWSGDAASFGVAYILFLEDFLIRFVGPRVAQRFVGSTLQVPFLDVSSTRPRHLTNEMVFAPCG